ncbi:Polysaccharide lyase family 4 protein [Mycena indigotica]|uniref:rhamnogalacturonan endolyase n=1 Tax=Mycena indigotica TaxID=2126181 RepID=A0A8H6TEN1_9AGAR|nr:Polysaccharide lyase family 4 protein [Mycena indigotica]KAF7315981.1 Polysaccharide lyase family 4 protein [Mycena indigotica]
MLRLLLAVVATLSCWVFSVAGFGLVVSGSNYVVTTDGGLTFTVASNTGDITSMVYNGVETQSKNGKNSQISSGIGASCSWLQGGNSNNYIVITCTTSTLTHYYIARRNDPAIHMGTYTSAEPSVGELRYIFRMANSALPNGPTVSNTIGGSAIEGSDVYLVNGQTRSKFYSSRQFIDDSVHAGVSGSGIAAFMIVPGTGFEGSSGGPFFRDIDNQNGGDQEVYFYMNSGHTNPDAFRQGFHGPYALWFTTGGTPTTYDYSFWEQFNISGYVKQAGRGRVSGKASNFRSQFSSLLSIGWSNSAAQYWVRTDSSGNFVSPYMKPGTYTMTLYEVELAVGTTSVTVSAGGTVTTNIASSLKLPTTIWSIGDYDGTPRGFLNADKIETMHPSDNRMSSWGPITFTVGNGVNGFPMAIFKTIGSVTIRSTLSSSQIGARTLYIATTLAFAGGRPVVTVGSFTSSTPAVPTQPDSRGVTRGTWRGNNILYTYSIPSGALVAGTNNFVISVASGSGGDSFLSPNIVFDSIWLA